VKSAQILFAEEKIYRVAIACGLVPLLIGLIIFGAWLPTRAVFLQMLGLIALCLGVILFFVGAFALLRYRHLAKLNPHNTPQQVLRASLRCWFVLLINFPISWAIINGVSAIESCYTVTAENKSNLAFEDIQIRGGGNNEALGNIGPGEQATYRLFFDSEGAVEISAKHRGERLKATLDGYVSPGLGGRADVVFQADATINVSHPNHR
jgi:hypothetical protein